MHSPAMVFMEGFFASGVLCLAYIRSLRAKIASYETFISQRIEERMVGLLDRKPSPAVSLSPLEAPQTVRLSH
ncbi:MAG TPA: hypothetical protein VG204_22315 [Terriglobia bacterium]|nr:hypothetical protein [Terriglobia bacterium]